MSQEHDFHGRAHDLLPGEPPPAMPAALRDAPLPAELEAHGRSEAAPMTDGGSIGGMLGGLAVYPRVHFAGRYGLACVAEQEFVRANLTWEDVKRVAWDAFGLCPKVVTIFDQRGGVLYRGNL